MPRAAYCAECSDYVWVGKDGGCIAGHTRSSLRGEYETTQDAATGRPLLPADALPYTVPSDARSAYRALMRGVWAYVGAIGRRLETKASSLGGSAEHQVVRTTEHDGELQAHLTSELNPAESKQDPAAIAPSPPVASAQLAHGTEWWLPSRPKNGWILLLSGLAVFALSSLVALGRLNSRIATANDVAVALGTMMDFATSTLTWLAVGLIVVGVRGQNSESRTWADLGASARRDRIVYVAVTAGLILPAVAFRLVTYGRVLEGALLVLALALTGMTKIASFAVTSWYSWRLGFGMLLAAVIALSANLPYMGIALIVILLLLRPGPALSSADLPVDQVVGPARGQA